MTRIENTWIDTMGLQRFFIQNKTSSLFWWTTNYLLITHQVTITPLNHYLSSITMLATYAIIRSIYSSFLQIVFAFVVTIGRVRVTSYICRVLTRVIYRESFSISENWIGIIISGIFWGIHSKLSSITFSND